MNAMGGIADNGKSERAARLQLDELRLALRNLRPNCWLMPIMAAAACVMFSRWVPLARLEIWFVIVALGCLPQFATAMLFMRSNPPPADVRRWYLFCAAGYTVFVLSWASMAFFLWVPGQEFDQLLVLVLLACTLAGNTALVGASRPLTLVSFAVYGSVLVLLPLTQGGIVYYSLAMMALFYVSYMAHLSRSIHDTARTMLTLRDEKDELIAELAKSKAESDEARKRAETASQAKSQFLANMSHELRTPLNAILGFSEMITSGTSGCNPDRQIEYAGIIHHSGNHLLALINDILDLAKIEAGGLKLKETPSSPLALIEGCVRLLEGKLRDGGLTLAIESPAELPDLRADVRAMRQVLLNLISNAIKFTPPGGRITVFARLEQDGTLAMGVRDTGLGIAAEDVATVFQNFGQGRHDVVTGDKGTGLGLPIVKGLIEAHGGRVELASTVGEGTCVTAFLPAERLQAPQGARRAG